MKKILLLVVMTISLNGCAALTENYIANNCNTNAAYAAGVNDARNNNDMNNNFASLCPVNQTQINAAYRRGYQFAYAGANQGINYTSSR